MSKENTPDNIDKELKNRLSNLPLHTPPPSIAVNVMARIKEAENNSLQKRCGQVIQQFLDIFSPRYAMGLIGVALISFYIGHTGFISPEPAKITSDTQPTNPQSAYLFGRGYLENNDFNNALIHLQQAATLAPNKAEYSYWLGIAYWKKGDLTLERDAYLHGLQHTPDSYPLLVNLGHNYLSSGSNEDALKTYKRALQHDPASQELLYNIAITYNLMGQKGDELETWKNYLSHYRAGAGAFKAVKRLSDNRDYSYRTYQVGQKRLILSQDILLDDSLSDDKREIELAAIAKYLKDNPHLEIDVVVFMEGQKLQAKAVAKKIKLAISKLAGDSNRVHLSWFGTAETRPLATDNIKRSNGVLIFDRPTQHSNKEV